MPIQGTGSCLGLRNAYTNANASAISAYLSNQAGPQGLSGNRQGIKIGGLFATNNDMMLNR